MAKSVKSTAKTTTNAASQVHTTAANSEISIRTWIIGVLLITAICFFPTLDNAFVNWDDDVNLLENKNTEALDAAHIKAIFTDRVIGNYNPLPILTFAIERHFVGLEPRLYHVNNLLLHLFATFFAFIILIQLGLRPLGAAVGALLFGIHPMRVESVAWVTERKDVLLTAFYFPAIYCYIKSIKVPERNKYYLIWAVVWFIFALLSKIQAVALPLTFLAIDYILGRDLKWNLIWEKAIFWAMSLITGLAGIYFLKDNGSLEEVASYSIIDRILIGMYTLNVYLIKFFYPYEMSPLYPYPSQLDIYFTLAPLTVLAFAGLTYWLWKQGHKAWVFGIAFFFVNVVFVLQVLGAGQAFLADRFTYIPYLGFFFIVAYYINKFEIENSSRKMTLLGIVGAFLLFSAFKTRQQCEIWQDGGTLWSHVLKYYPDSELPWGNRARFYRENQKDYIRALEGYTEAINIKGKPESYNSRGKTYFDLAGYPDLMKKLGLTMQDCTKKALDDYNKALSMDISKTEKKYVTEMYTNRAAAFGRYSQETGDKSFLNNALQDINKAMEFEPTDNTYLNGFLVNSELGNLQQALLCIDKYSETNPGESDMQYERAIIHRKLGDDKTALADLQKAIQQAQAELRGQDMQKRNRGKLILGVAHNESARIYLRQGDIPKVKAAYQEAIKSGFDPKNVDAEIVAVVQ
jgi:protein O-mannosyl-transferase